MNRKLSFIFFTLAILIVSGLVSAIPAPDRPTPLNEDQEVDHQGRRFVQDNGLILESPSVYSCELFPNNHQYKNWKNCTLTIDVEDTSDGTIRHARANGLVPVSFEGEFDFDSSRGSLLRFHNGYVGSWVWDYSTTYSNVTRVNRVGDTDYEIPAREFRSFTRASEATVKTQVFRGRNALLDPDIAACGTLNVANSVYTLNTSVQINGSTCFTISASNITLDGAGFSIIGNSTPNTLGITMSSSINNFNVKNLNISRFASGISFGSHIHNVTINNSQIFVSSGIGITMSSTNVSDIYIQNTIVDNSTTYGIYLSAFTWRAYFYNVTVARNAGTAGIRFDGGNWSTLDGMTFRNISFFAIDVNGGAGDSLQVTNSVVDGMSSAGWRLQGNNPNVRIHNTTVRNVGAAVLTTGTFMTNFTFTNNLAFDNAQGITPTSVYGGYFANNNITVSGNSALVLSSSHNNTFINNYFSRPNGGSYVATIQTGSSNNTLNGNTFFGATHGIGIIGTGGNDNHIINNTFVNLSIDIELTGGNGTSIRDNIFDTSVGVYRFAGPIYNINLMDTAFTTYNANFTNILGTLLVNTTSNSMLVASRAAGVNNVSIYSGNNVLGHNNTRLCSGLSSVVNDNDASSALVNFGGTVNNCIVLNNYNHTLGVVRTSDPVSDGPTTAISQAFSSSLLDALNMTVLFAITNDPADLGNIDYTSGTGTYNRVFTKNQYTIIGNTIMVNAVVIDLGSNLFSYYYGCSDADRANYEIIRIAMGLLILGFVFFYLFRNGTDGLMELNVGDFLILAVGIITGSILLSANADIIAATCAP